LFGTPGAPSLAISIGYRNIFPDYVAMKDKAAFDEYAYTLGNSINFSLRVYMSKLKGTIAN
jgi:hypothetical protein